MSTFINVKPCEKTCCECGFTKNGTTDTLYADFYEILEKGIIFPCHMYLKSKTGCENKGTETLSEVKVCRGYVAFIKQFPSFMRGWNTHTQQMWNSELLSKIDKTELKDIRNLTELMDAHRGLKFGIKLKN